MGQAQGKDGDKVLPKEQVTPVVYGVGGPFIIQQTAISKELMDYLLDCEIFKVSEDQLLQNGFRRSVDHPTLPDHIYYEGYFHALPTKKQVLSMNPRTGMDYEKPAAPIRLRAFAEACRRLNDHWIRQALSGTAIIPGDDAAGASAAGGAGAAGAGAAADAAGASAAGGAGAAAAAAAAAAAGVAGVADAGVAAAGVAAAGAAATTATASRQLDFAKDPMLVHLRKLYQQNKHFADLAVQVHFGDEVDADHAAWHKDAVNSALHMAVSLGGHRAMHSKHSESPIVHAPNGVQTTVMAKHVHWQQPGDVYVSSPYLFGHAVQYEKCTWDNRIIAMQCRFLMQLEDLMAMSSLMTGEDAMANSFAAVMSRCRVQMPDLQTVQAVEAELAKMK